MSFTYTVYINNIYINEQMLIANEKKNFKNLYISFTAKKYEKMPIANLCISTSKTYKL